MIADLNNAIYRIATSLKGLNRAKLELEYAVMEASAKGLAPNADGTPPEGVTLDTNGMIQGTDLAWAEYAQAMGGIGAIVGTLEANDKAVEKALLRFQR